MEILLSLIVAAIAIFTSITGAKEYRQLIASRGKKRLSLYKHWIAESWLLFGLFSVVALILLGHAHHIFQPLRSMSLINVSQSQWESDRGSIILGLIVGIALALVILYFRSKRALKKAAKNPDDIILPQTKQEKHWAGVMAITAGVCEELFFRAAVPVLAFLITGDITLSLAVGIILFGLQHIYQGWRGVLGTAVLGWVLTKVFLATGTILAPIALHAIIDINGLLVLPILSRIWARNSS